MEPEVKPNSDEIRRLRMTQQHRPRRKTTKSGMQRRTLKRRGVARLKRNADIHVIADARLFAVVAALAHWKGSRGCCGRGNSQLLSDNLPSWNDVNLGHNWERLRPCG